MAERQRNLLATGILLLTGGGMGTAYTVNQHHHNKENVRVEIAKEGFLKPSPEAVTQAKKTVTALEETFKTAVQTGNSLKINELAQPEKLKAAGDAYGVLDAQMHYQKRWLDKRDRATNDLFYALGTMTVGLIGTGIALDAAREMRSSNNRRVLPNAQSATA